MHSSIWLKAKWERQRARASSTITGKLLGILFYRCWVQNWSECRVALLRRWLFRCATTMHFTRRLPSHQRDWQGPIKCLVPFEAAAQMLCLHKPKALGEEAWWNQWVGPKHLFTSGLCTLAPTELMLLSTAWADSATWTGLLNKWLTSCCGTVLWALGNLTNISRNCLWHITLKLNLYKLKQRTLHYKDYSFLMTLALLIIQPKKQTWKQKCLWIGRQDAGKLYLSKVCEFNL